MSVMRENRQRMEKEDLPPYSLVETPSFSWRHKRRSRIIRLIPIFLLLALAYQTFHQRNAQIQLLNTERLKQDHATCAKLRRTLKEPSGPRVQNLRWNNSTKPVLIRNATIWTGEPTPGISTEDARTDKGWSWITGDVFLEHGLIKRIAPAISRANLPTNYDTYEANGRPLTAGIVDMHSHAGVYGIPALVGNQDTNELSNDITPYVRSIDGFNPLDEQIQVIKSGGVTTSLILPGSGNNMGGEAYVMKFAVGREQGRSEISAADMLANPEGGLRWMKMACGENAKRVYGRIARGPFSRLGEAWAFRHAFEQAAALNREQDDWCEAADKMGAENMQSYLPQDLQWESLGAVLRGQVYVNTHCYTVPDLEAFVSHTNEFKFEVRAFHHAHQTYLVPEILKRAYGRPPASALFADNMYYKAEAYTASEKAGAILYANGLTPVYVSDNPVLNAQHVVFEAAKAYKYGLPYHAALNGVTAAPAELLGLGERIGKIKEGFDADIVVWDSDPLSVGATPQQVWIDGVSQFDDPFVYEKPDKSLIINEPVSEGSSKNLKKTDVIFTGVRKLAFATPHKATKSHGVAMNVVIESGRIVCVGGCDTHTSTASKSGIEIIDLKNGYITPAFTAFGSFIGLSEIDAELSTQDGVNPVSVFSRAVDGLALDNKQLQASHIKGVTRAITAPDTGRNAHRGVSVGFSTGGQTPLGEGIVWADEIAVHYPLSLSGRSETTPSISSAVGGLRRGLMKALKLNETNADPFSEEAYLRRVVTGDLPLVLDIHSADTIAAALRVKAEVESSPKSTASIRMIIHGGAEAHLIAHEIATANVGVVLAPLLPYSERWDQRRSLIGAPFQNGTTVNYLIDAGVLVSIGTKENWEVRELSLMAGIAYANSNGRLSEEAALGLISSNIYRMLDLEKHFSTETDFVVFEGNPLETNSRVRAVVDGRGTVEVI